jgi:hypothetical protein
MERITTAGAVGVSFEELVGGESGEAAMVLTYHLGWLMKIGVVELMI